MLIIHWFIHQNSLWLCVLFLGICILWEEGEGGGGEYELGLRTKSPIRSFLEG